MIYDHIMHCPTGDNLLIDQKPSHTNGLSLHYLACPTCGGHWLSAFDANYLRSIDLPNTPLASKGLTLRGYACPQCRKILERTTGDNIPPDVVAYHCPDGHGYFFPAGELRKFKEAQEAKLTYHQRWHVPLSSVASAMLMTFFGLALSAGLLLGVIEGQRQQTITSQAAELITSQKAYVDAASRSEAPLRGVTIIALTSEAITLAVILDGQEYSMLAPDSFSHVIRITGLAPGDHSYFFRFQKEGRLLRSPLYSFSTSK